MFAAVPSGEDYFGNTVHFFTQNFKPDGWGAQPGIQQHPQQFITDWLQPYTKHLRFLMLLEGRGISRGRAPPSLHQGASSRDTKYLDNLRNKVQCLQHLPDASWRPVLMYAMQQLQSWKAAQDQGALKVPLLALLDEVAAQLECLMVCMHLSKPRISKATRAQLLRSFMARLRGFIPALELRLQATAARQRDADVSITRLREMLREELQMVTQGVGAAAMPVRLSNLRQKLKERQVAGGREDPLGRALLLMWYNQLSHDHGTSGFDSLYYSNINVCHVMPPVRDPHWMDDYAGWTKQSHKTWLNRLGNLCLLETSVICSVQNSSYAERSAKVLASYPGTGHSLASRANRRPFEHAEWNVARCSERTAEMADVLATDRWHLPQAAAGESLQ